jgi:hypothetical protein
VKIIPTLALLGAAAACARQPQPRPQVLAPVRLTLDSAGALTAAAPAAPSRPRAFAGVFDAREDSPFYSPSRAEWPGPNEFRSSTGAPGPRYWQQRADYTIDVALDTAAAAIAGTVAVRYTNNSPDSLRFVWMQLDQNLYRSSSRGSALFPADSRFGVRGFEGGYELREVRVNGQPVAPKVDDTMMRLDMPAGAIPPGGGTATITVSYRFAVPEHGSDRMGRDGTHFFIAQWYPRMAVYDDVRGWNTDPYLGQGEFYLEYGNIDYSVTVPAGYTVAGSGVLQNPEQALTAGQRTRLAQAARSDATVAIISAAERAPRATAGTKTWRFRAENVRDVAWSGAPDYRWDASSVAIPGGKRVTTHAYYTPKAGGTWQNAAQFTRHTIATYSTLFFPYPYPQATSVGTTVGGMEYPMFVMNGYNTDEPTSVFRVNDHEHGHEWYPMIVGSNERRYAWMDEGFNTYINAFSNERFFPGTSAWTQYVTNWKNVVANGTQSPLMTRPDHVEGSALGAIAYRKPGAVLLALRNHVVGAETFDRAFLEYTRRWAFKHPTPGDFFRTVENVSGMELGWYWRSFFYTSDVLDLGIDSVSTSADSAGTRLVRVALSKHTTIPFPVEMRLKLADGSTQEVRLPVDVWARGDRFEATVAVRANVVGARLWPVPSVPDFNAANDTWGDAPAADPLGPVTGGGLATPIPAASAQP